MGEEKVEVSQSGLEKLLVQSLTNFQEERDLALERYRRQDEKIESNDDFILQGKNAVDYLKTAADRSNAIFGVAKLIKDIVYKDGQEGGSGSGTNDSQKSDILKFIQEIKEGGK